MIAQALRGNELEKSIATCLAKSIAFLSLVCRLIKRKKHLDMWNQMPLL